MFFLFVLTNSIGRKKRKRARRQARETDIRRMEAGGGKTETERERERRTFKEEIFAEPRRILRSFRWPYFIAISAFFRITPVLHPVRPLLYRKHSGLPERERGGGRISMSFLLMCPNDCSGNL